MPPTATPMRPTELELLRRPYTRSMPPVLRSVRLLAASFADVKQQWHALLSEEITHLQLVVSSLTTSQSVPAATMKSDSGARDEGAAGAAGVDDGKESCIASAMRAALSPHAKQVLGTVTRLTGQLKAIKQELIAHISHTQSCSAMTRMAKTDSVSTTSGFFAHLLRDPFSNGENEEEGAGTAGVFAASEENRHQPVISADEDAKEEEEHGAMFTLTLARRVWVWTLFFSLVLSDMELLSGTISYGINELFPTTTKQHSAALCDGLRSASSECTSFFFSQPSHTESEPCVQAGTDDGQGSCSTSCTDDSDDDDAVFFHGCAVVYNAFANESSPRDSSAHERSLLDPWWSRALTGPPAPGADGGNECHTNDATSCIPQHAFAMFVIRIGRAVVEGDPSAVRAILDEVETASGRAPWAVVLRLFVRLLMETLVRPQWGAEAMQNAFRPIPPLTSSEDVRAEVLLRRSTVHAAWRALGGRVCGGEMSDDSPASSQPFKRTDNAFAACAVLCDVLQLCSLERLCSPWPVPEEMLHNCVVA